MKRNQTTGHSLAKQLIMELSKKTWTISTAESCSGGLLASTIVNIPGASRCFAGSVVAYANQVKINLLGVSPGLLSTVGAVSRPVVLEMAINVRKLLKTNTSIAISGIAGPEGGSVHKPVGFMCMAWTGPGYAESIEMVFHGTRQQIRSQCVQYALERMLIIARGRL